MSTTILNYPGFQTLPKGVKQMLLASEAHFFDHGEPPSIARQYLTQAVRVVRGSRDFRINPLFAPRSPSDESVCPRNRREPGRRDSRTRITIGALCEVI
jgi:hypothetical protein